MIARAAFLAGAVAIVATIAQAADPFYLRLLREGTDSYNRREFAAAARQLRTACFGLLEEPELLADGLVRLGLAQGAAGEREAFAETFQRVAEVEERFAGYSRATIPADVRDAFGQLVVKIVPALTLAERPAIARLVPGAADRTARAAAAPLRPAATPTRPAALAPTRTPALPAPAVPTSAPPTPSPAATATRPPAPTPVRTQAPVPTPPAAAPAVAQSSLTSPPPIDSAPAARPPARKATADETRELGAIQELVRKNKMGDALQRARKLADGHADLAEAQFVAAELAYRMLRFPEAVAYFRRGGDPGDGRPLLLFYEAVSRYETGDGAGAATALRRALPNIRRTSYVEAYVRKILSSDDVLETKP